MSNKILAEKARPLGNYPHIKRVGDFLFISGTSSRRPDNTHVGAVQDANGNWILDIRQQTVGVLLNVESYLKSFSADLSHVVDICTFLVNMDDFQGYNEVYGKFFDQETGPTRTTVAVSQLPHPNLLVEMKIIAYSPVKDIVKEDA